MWWRYGFFKVQGQSRNIFHSLLCSCLADRNWCYSNEVLKGSHLLCVWIWFMNSRGGGSGPQWSLYKHVYMFFPVFRGKRIFNGLAPNTEVSKVCLILTPGPDCPGGLRNTESPGSILHVWQTGMRQAQLKDRYICAKTRMSCTDAIEIRLVAIWVNVARWHLKFFRIRLNST